jgi:hypothetical protein
MAPTRLRSTSTTDEASCDALIRDACGLRRSNLESHVSRRDIGRCQACGDP